MTGFELVLDVRARLGESPVWSVDEQALYFVDIKGQVVHRYRPETGNHLLMPVDEDIGCIGLVRGGGIIAGLRSGIWRLNEEARPLEKLADNPEDHSTSRFNDGRCDPAGRFLAGTVDEPKAGGNAHLYRYDQRGLEVITGGLLTSNGLAFSPEGTTLYHSDTPRFVVHRYDYDVETGAASNRRLFVQLKPQGEDRGRPDGAAVDAEGCYWTALYEGGRVQRYSPEGRLLSTHPAPAKRPTMVAFGGEDLRTLYLTTARDGADEEELARFPHSGGLFAMAVETPGLREPQFDPER
jgi:sugar lactone lactonase YvrE